MSTVSNYYSGRYRSLTGLRGLRDLDYTRKSHLRRTLWGGRSGPNGCNCREMLTASKVLLRLLGFLLASPVAGLAFSAAILRADRARWPLWVDGVELLRVSDFAIDRKLRAHV